MSEAETTKRIATHLDEMTCLLYMERQLDRARGLEVSAHAQECEACRTLLRALERESRLLTRALLEEDEAMPARLAAFQESARRSMQWIWGVIFGLAATGAYAFYMGYIEPWQQQLEQAGFGGSNLLSLLIFQGAFWKGWQSVITLVEVLALVTVGGFGAAFFRRRIRGVSAVVLMLSGFCAAMALPPAASAAEHRKGETIEIAKDETIKGDLFVSCGRGRVDGTIEGDLFFFGQTLDVNGHVKGDVIAFAEAVRINGQVDGNVRSFVSTLTVSGNVSKNVLTFNEVTNVDAAGKVGGSLTAFASSVGMDGKLGGDLFAFTEQTTISGNISGGVQERSDSLTIRGGAQVDGPIHFEGNNPPEVSPQARLASAVDFKKNEHKKKYEGSYYVWQVIWTASFLLFGLVLFVLMPRFSQEVVASGERLGASLGLGVLVFFGVPIAAVIACITVVGILVGISAFALWLAALGCAQIVVGAVVGKWLLGRSSEMWPLIGRMAVGLIVVRVAGMVPYVGGLVKFTVVVWGVGAIALALYRRFQPVVAPKIPSPPTMPPISPNVTIGGMQPA